MASYVKVLQKSEVERFMDLMITYSIILKQTELDNKL